MGGSREMLLDAIYLAVHNISGTLVKSMAGMEWSGMVEESVPHHDNFKVDWRANTDRIIILFTDEPPQSYLANSLGTLTVNDISIAVQGTPQLKLYIFSTNENWDWDELAADGSGKYFDLTDNPTEMYNSLMEILDEICKSGGANAEE